MSKLQARLERARNSVISSNSNPNPKIDREEQRARMRPEVRPNLKDSIKVSLGLQSRLTRHALKEEVKSVVAPEKVEKKVQTLADLAQEIKASEICLSTITYVAPKIVSIIPIEGYSHLQQRIDSVRGYDSRKIAEEFSSEPESLSTSGVSSCSSPFEDQTFDRIKDCAFTEYSSSGASSRSPSPAPVFHQLSVNAVPFVPSPVDQQQSIDYIAARALSKLTPQQSSGLQSFCHQAPKYFVQCFEYFVEYWGIQGIPLDMEAVADFLLTRGIKIVKNSVV